MMGRAKCKTAGFLARTALVVSCVCAWALPAFAQDGGTRVELNRLEPQGENCRTYLLIDNSKGDAYRSLKLDLFALDTDGVAAKRLAVEVGPVPEKKRLIKLFDWAWLACARVGSVLLNDVLTCEGPGGPRESCLAALDTASKADPVTFVK